MFKVTISSGSAHGLGIKVMTFQTKEDAVVFITAQLNRILNNPNTIKWDISCMEIRAINKS